MTHESAHGERSSERGMALIMVLLLLAVVSSLATGLAMNGQVEVAMASNEATYAGARAAAEAGMNRAIAAIVANTTDDLLAGEDGLLDPDNLAAPANADNGDIGYLLTGAPPYVIGPNDEYWYEIEILDDDDPVLHPVALTADQLLAMSEDGNGANNVNGRLILRVTGFGPNGTTVRIGRILMVQSYTNPGEVPPPEEINPAILVNGDLIVSGNIDVMGANGSIHANGNLTTDGSSWSVEGNATASGTVTGGCSDCAGGVTGGSRPTVTVPDVNAADYEYLATHVLQSNGQILTVADGTTCSSCHGWSFSGGTWSITGTGTAGTFFAQGDVSISGNVKAAGPGKNPLPLSVIATGSIQVTGTPVLMPHNALALQFVTNGDLKIAGNVDLDPIEVEGRSLVREQLSLAGNPDLRGQIIVQDFRGCGESCSGLVTDNVVTGNVDVTYDGTFDALDLESIPPPPIITYDHDVVGWLEGI